MQDTNTCAKISKGEIHLLHRKCYLLFQNEFLTTLLGELHIWWICVWWNSFEPTLSKTVKDWLGFRWRLVEKECSTERTRRVSGVGAVQRAGVSSVCGAVAGRVEGALSHRGVSPWSVVALHVCPVDLTVQWGQHTLITEHSPDIRHFLRCEQWANQKKCPPPSTSCSVLKIMWF